MTSDPTAGDLVAGAFLCVYLGISIPAAIISCIGLFNCRSPVRELLVKNVTPKFCHLSRPVSRGFLGFEFDRR